MFKGIVSLFRTGLIFSPFVLLGIIGGSWCYFNMEPLEIKNLLLMKHFYAVVLFASIVFVFVFGRVYDDRGNHLDLSAMSWKIIGNIVKFFLSFVLVMSFISMFSIF